MRVQDHSVYGHGITGDREPGGGEPRDRAGWADGFFAEFAERLAHGDLRPRGWSGQAANSLRGGSLGKGGSRRICSTPSDLKRSMASITICRAMPSWR